MAEYNGWTNWSTWNLALWAGNDEDTYAAVRSGGPYTAESAQAMGESLYGSDIRDAGTPDMDPGDMAYVDWQEIAAAWNEE